MGGKTALFRTWVLLIATAGIFLRLYDLGGQSLWVDEAYTWSWLNQTWTGLIDILLDDVGNLPAYYFFAKPVRDLFGSSEAALRLVSSITGILGLWVSFRIGEIAGGKPGAIAGLWFWAFHPMAIWYSRDAKPYALSALLAGSLLVFFLLLRKKIDKTSLTASLTVMAVGLLSHYYYFVFAMGLVCFLIAEMRLRPRLFRTWTIVFILSLVPLGLWLALIFSRPEPSIGSGWISPVGLKDTILTIWNLASGYAGKASISSTLFGMLVCMLVILSFFQAEKGVSPRRLFIFNLALPVLGVYLVSLRRPIYVDRYFIVLLPMVAYLAAAGAAVLWQKMESRLSPALMFALFFIPLGLGVGSAWTTLTGQTYAKESWADLADDLAQFSPEPPSIWFSDQVTIVPFAYYFSGEFDPIWSEIPPVCTSTCWWVLRQPFTATHAFTQAVHPIDRQWLPSVPGQCRTGQTLDYGTGIQLWEVICD